MNDMNKLLEKYRKIPIPLKASIWFIFCNILLKGISFFTAPMFARLLSTEEYGKLSIFASYEQIIIIFATWEVGLSPFQRGIFKFKENIRTFRSVIIFFSMLTSLIVTVIILCFGAEIVKFTEMPIWLLLVLLLYTFVYTAYVSWMTENKLNYNYRHVSIMTISMAIIQILCSMTAVTKIKATAEIKLLFTLLPAIIVSSILFFKRFKPLQIIRNGSVAKEQLRFLLVFTWPLVIHSLSYLVLGQADRIMIGKMVSNSAAGLYSVSYTIASVVIIVQSGVLQVLSPWIYHQMDRKSFDVIRKKILSILFLVSALYILFMLIAPDVIICMYPEYYWEGIWCIPPISMGVYFMFMYSLFVAIEECLDQTKYVALVSITCALINLLLNYLGIKLFGYIACAYTTLFCYILFAVGHYYFMSKILKQKYNDAKVYDGRLFFVVSLIMLVIMVGITFSYSNRIIRYSLAVIMIIFGIANKKKILSILSQFKQNSN